jgi:ribosomal protein S18 acetylase RimI-like enzyme
VGIQVVTATVDDWQRVRAVRLRALADAPDAFWTTLEQDTSRPDQLWRDHLELTTHVTLLGVLDGVEEGMVWGMPHHANRGEAGLYGMWVAPEARGTGLAKALVEAVIVWARRSGYGVIRLDVNDDNVAAQRLYAQCGAVPTGRRDTFPPPREHIQEHELLIDLS